MSGLEVRMCREHFTALPCWRCGLRRVTLETLPGNDDNWLRDRWLSAAREALAQDEETNVEEPHWNEWLTPDLRNEGEGEKETKG